MLERLSSTQLAGWMAYYALEPWGEERADLRSGWAAAVLANHWRSGRPLQPADCVPDLGRHRQGPRERREAVRAWALASGGTEVTPCPPSPASPSP